MITEGLCETEDWSNGMHDYRSSKKN